MLFVVAMLSEGRWECRCDCGTFITRTSYQLIGKKIRSCGCYRGRRLPDGVAAANALLSTYRNSAKSFGRVFTLTDEEFGKLTSSNCHYCGSSPSRKRRSGAKRDTGEYVFNGIDRVDNEDGYTTLNCVSCCTTCNRAKREMSYGDFVGWLEIVARFRA